MNLAFAKALVNDPRCTGAIAPSSVDLALTMVRHWPRSPRGLIVEFGPGTGAFTEEILCRLGGKRFLAIELNGIFVEQLRKRFHGVDVHHGSAEELPQAMAARGLRRAELIVSGLPWALIETKVQRRILATSFDCLSRDGVFSTIAYVHALWMPGARNFNRLLRGVFPRVEVSRVVWRNLPPAVVYHAFKGRRRGRLAPASPLEVASLGPD